MTYESPSPDSGPRVTRDHLRDLSTLRRASDQKMVAGVAEGLSRHFDIDPLIIRVLFGTLVLFGGAGIVLYVIAWITIPREGRHDSPMSGVLRRDPSRVMVAGLTIAAVVGAATMIGAIGFSAPNPFPVLLISLIAIAAFTIFSRRSDRQAPYPPPMTQTEAPPATELAVTDATSTDAASTDTTSTETTSTDDASPDRAWWQRPDAAGYGGGPYPPPGSFGAEPPPVRRQRSHLFVITMAVVAIAEGALWILDATVYDDFRASIYPGTALGVIAAALILGTWYGRSRLLILAGLFATFITVIAQVAGPGPYGEQIYRPTSAASVQATYDHGIGRVVLHLEDVTDPENLDGRLVDIDQRIGQLQVIVPSSLAVVINAHVDHGQIEGPPSSLVTDLEDSAEQITVSSVPADAATDLTLDLDLDFGEILITQYDCPSTGAARNAPGLDTSSTTGDFHAAAACN